MDSGGDCFTIAEMDEADSSTANGTEKDVD